MNHVGQMVRARSGSGRAGCGQPAVVPVFVAALEVGPSRRRFEGGNGAETTPSRRKLRWSLAGNWSITDSVATSSGWPTS
jgi:hypothetical protein